MGYIAWLNKARSRISEIVSPFGDTCRATIADEGLLTVSNMLYCLNSVSKTFANGFNGSLERLRAEFGIKNAAKVGYSQLVTAADLKSWGIGAFFDKSMDERVFDEILQAERQKLCANIGKTFSTEEQKYAKHLADEKMFSGNAELQAMQKHIAECEALLQELMVEE
ncbi:MAG: hypothetical protein LBU32_23505 [Clostridiales bacterium]|jgi:hypothetical protein|nr:hypothetical protein [Clostridiales bacterium]